MRRSSFARATVVSIRSEWIKEFMRFRNIAFRWEGFRRSFL
jgi:hypothetical protein